jgi:hypothetical protein
MHPPSGLSSLPPFPSFGHRDHDVQFYSDDDSLADGIENLLRGALEKGDGAIYVATKKHLAALAGRFRMRDQGMTAATEQGRYLPVDVADVLSAVMSDGKFDEAGISKILESAIRRTSATVGGGENRVAVFGEIAARLWSEGKCEEVLRWERSWNHLSRLNPVSARCAYPIQGFSRPCDDEYLQMICGEHSAVIAPASFPLPADEPDPDQLLAQERQLIKSNGGLSYPQWQPQYQAAVLETELAPLFERIEVAQAAVVTRLHELRTQTGHYTERHQLIRAWHTLQIIKREQLGFLE